MDALTAMKQALELLPLHYGLTSDEYSKRERVVNALRAAISAETEGRKIGERDQLKLELWEDGALLHESHYKYQGKLEDMIRTLLFSEKNHINDDFQHEAIKLLGSLKKPRCSSTN